MSDSYLYRIHFAPAHRRGSFRAVAMVSISIAALVEGGELNLIRHHAAEYANQLLGSDAPALRVPRVQRQERDGTWRDMHWPIPCAARVEDLVFSTDGECLTNVIPTWPE